MADGKSMAPSLKPVVPKILNTEISPLNRSSSTMTLASPSIFYTLRDNIDFSDTPASTEQFADTLSKDSSDEHGPVQEYVQWNIPILGPTTQRLYVEDVESDNPNTEDDDLENVSPSATESLIGGLHEFCYRCPEFLNTKYSIVFWLLLLALPIYSGFIGTRYIRECKISPIVPVLLALMSIMGVIIITLKITLIMHNILWEEEFCQPCFYNSIALFLFITVILFFAELITFWSFSPSFDASSPHYCNIALYNSAYWINWIMVALVIIMFVISRCYNYQIILRQNSY